MKPQMSMINMVTQFKTAYLLIISLMLLSGCTAKQEVVQVNNQIKDISVFFKNDTQAFKDVLLQRLGNKYSTNSSNKLYVDVIRNDVTHSRYKKKIYIKDGLYEYKICHVDTHYLDIAYEYKKDSLIVTQDTIRTTTNNDSCDRYMFDDYKAYAVSQTVDKIMNSI